MAAVFGIDFFKSTTGLLKGARKLKKVSPWGGAEADNSGLANEGRDANVSRLVEDEIIPRLLMVHQDDLRVSHFESPRLIDFRDTSDSQSNDNDIYSLDATPIGRRPRVMFDAATIERFAKDVLKHEVDELADQVTHHLDQGVSPETLFVDLIAPAARKMGTMWDDDLCDFVDVTMGLWRLQQLLRTIAAWGQPAPGWHNHGRKILLSTLPGDQHSLGTLIISEIFQRDGWDVETMIEPQQSDIFRSVSENAFDVIGLTVTTDFHIGTLPKLLTAIRNVSCNPKIAIMIGGPALGYDPARAIALGADGTALDAAAALTLADKLVSAGVVQSSHTI